MKRYAWLLLAVGLLQMAGDVTGADALRALGAATAASPAPRVFSAVRGFETYSTRFFVEWRDGAGEEHELELTPEVAARLRGPYNRRNVFGAALAYGPVLAASERARPLLDAVLAYGLAGDAPLLAELGVGAEGARAVALRYEPREGTRAEGLPLRIEVPR